MISNTECHPNKIPTRLKGYKRIKKIWSWKKCRELCNDDPDCEFFKWKRSQCRLMSVAWENRITWVSGAKYCSELVVNTMESGPGK